MKLALLGIILVQLLGTCAPPYHRPDTDEPPAYRDEAQASQVMPPLGELGWWEVFKDPQLQSLLRTAVAQNYDIRVAAQRIQEAEAQYTVIASNQYPQINALLSAQYQQINGKRAVLQPKSTFAPNGLLTLQYEVDLFGKVRSQAAVAAAQVLETDFARETVTASIVSAVATLYFQLRELDVELAISKETLAARRQSLQLVQYRFQGGIATLQDVRQSQELVYETAAVIPVIERTIAQTEDTLSILIGSYPNAVQRGLPLTEQVALPRVPAAGIPSAILEQRPDIRASEETLIAANAQIGVARALLYPQFTISAGAGAGTAQANGVALGPFVFPQSNLGQGYISILPQIVQQIFNAGAARANVAGTEAAKEAAVLQYVQTVHQAFGDVSDALIAYDKNREAVIEQTAYAAAAVDALRLANLRYEGGVTSYLEVLVSDTQAYSAQISLEQALLNERLAVVQLYKATGGGWQPEPGVAAR
ncbi:MAG: efflux transporter outer membrane subunit [Candidatus Eremiobacteraeota bacterium]|nr:efflux transporter outer membrane subunit [Candidatus Eremiobacteraeota bacterium]